MSNGGQPASRAVTVVVPTRNRPARLAACLTALAAQTFPRSGFEVLVVDDGSTTSMEPVVAPFRDVLELQLIRQANAGPARARNAGAEHASGALLAFTDDDCEPDANWLSALHARSAECPDSLIGGQTVNGLPDNVYSTASHLLIEYLYEYHATRCEPGATRPPAAPAFFTSNNFAVPATLFRAAGGFDESFPLAAGEDRELCDRWQQSGFALSAAPNARVTHAHALSLRRFWRQHLNYGRGACHLRRARLMRDRPALRMEPLSFYWRLVTYPARATAPSKAVPLMGLMGLSQVANTWGFLSEKLRSPRPGL